MAASASTVGAISGTPTSTDVVQAETNVQLTKFSDCITNKQSNDIAWSTDRNDTGLDVFDQEVNRYFDSKPNEKWRSKYGIGGLHSPIVKDGILYVSKSRPNSRTTAVNPANGEIIWRNTGKGRVPTSPILDQDRIYSVIDDSTIAASTVKNGKKDWEIEFPEETITSISGLNGLVLFGTHGQTPILGSLNAQTGKKCWKLELSSPAREVTGLEVQDDIIYYSCYGMKTDHPDIGIVGAVDSSSRQVLWEVRTTQPALGLSKTEKGVYVRTKGSVHAIDATTGQSRWSVHTHGGSSASPIVVKDTVYAGGLFKILAIDSESGSVKWTHEISSNNPHPIVAGNKVYFTADTVGGRSAIFSALNRNSGKKLWSVDVGKRRLSAPFLNDQLIHIAAQTLGQGNPGMESYEAKKAEIITFN
ncbi:outer membrane protein assembly factor BamB family protein [Halorussus halophilus]|uniref:outer membrane protein assembly factor BamB family protein n=1 Tax=Halorussus halophilus TaxID=2650975 RepID=UPI00130189CC|nr:PQQ-binding-like beta-propeller repeat protein [Halorussus halophilus]